MLHRLIWILLLGLLAVPALAQSAPLVGPLLALNRPDQRSVLLYDLGSETWREWSLGPRDHYVWGFTEGGCRVLLTLAEGSRPARLLSVGLDGRDARELIVYDELPAADWGVWEPQVTPDGERIAFTWIRNQPTRGGGTRRDTHIAWVDAAGGAPTLYSVTGREYTPQWSPDGAWLAYVSYDERPAGETLFATAVPTAEPPPGVTPPPPVLLNEADLWVVSRDGETKYRLTSFATGSVSMPRWSGDSELVSFVYSPSGGNDTFWMIANQERAIATQLSFTWNLILDMTWLPDSTAILGVARDFRGVAQNVLWRIPLVGSADDNATRYLETLDLPNADYPRFSLDGRWLALRSAYDLALVDLSDSTLRLLGARALGNTPPIWSPAAFAGEADCAE